MKTLFFILILISANIYVFPLLAGEKVEANEVMVKVKPGMSFVIIEMDGKNEFIMFAAKVDAGFKQDFEFSLSFTYPSASEIKSHDWKKTTTAQFPYDLHYKVQVLNSLSDDHVGLLLPVSKFRKGNYFLAFGPTDHVDLILPDGKNLFLNQEITCHVFNVEIFLSRIDQKTINYFLRAFSNEEDLKNFLIEKKVLGENQKFESFFSVYRPKKKL